MAHYAAGIVSLYFKGRKCALQVWVQDTPGYESSRVQQQILDYARSQDAAFFATEEDAERTLPMAMQADPRVNLCLAFLDPHVLKTEDLNLIKEMSLAGIPVIPIVAKVSYACSE